MTGAVAAATALPFDEAIAFLRQKTLLPSERWHDVWNEAHARGFAVAGATGDALLRDFRAAVDRALSAGSTLATFRADFDAIVAKHGWTHAGTPGWRASIIYETNLSTAYSAGRYAQMTAPGALRAFPYWQYRHTACRHPRLMHLAWDGLTLRADDPWWDTHWPPNGWRCGCRVAPVSEAGLRRMGRDGPDPTPPTVMEPWTNPRTGEIKQVPVGIDPGFGYNVGKAWRDAPLRASPFRPAEPREPQPTQAKLDALRTFFARPEGDAPVGKLSAALRGALPRAPAEAVLPAATARRAAARGVRAQDAMLLPLLVGDPLAVAAGDGGVLAAVQLGGAALAALLVAGDADAPARIVALRRMRRSALERLLRRRGVTP